MPTADKSYAQELKTAIFLGIRSKKLSKFLAGKDKARPFAF